MKQQQQQQQQKSKDTRKLDGNQAGIEYNDGELTFKDVLMENTDEFCKHSTLHGLKYVVDEQLYPMERIFFALSFLAVVFISAFFITNVYAKWTSTPVIVGLNPAQTFIVDEPFPAVTICNLNQASRKKANKYRESSSEYAMLQLLCKREVDMEVAGHIDWNTFEEFIVNISQPCEKMLVGCYFGAMEYKCNEIFRSIVTDEGLCCVFNMAHPSFMYDTEVSSLRNISYTDDAVPIKWDPEHGYPPNLPEKFYPRKAAGTGETLGLSLTLDVDVGDYYCSSSTSIGFKIALHSPTETPHVREVGNLLAAGMETKIRIRTDKSEAARNLKSINKIYRQCLFEGEAKLTYFSYYNRRNCEMECNARELYDHCNCISHYMPTTQANARICGIKDTPCVEKIRQNKVNTTEDCQKTCWPSCFDVSFYTDFFSAPISHEGFAIANELVKNMSNEYAEKNMAVAHLFFKDNTFRTTKQTEFVGITDVLSSIGGLMGLFMGFSFISIAEFIYYAVLRPIHVIKRHERITKNSALSHLTNHRSSVYHPPNQFASRASFPNKLQQFPGQMNWRSQMRFTRRIGDTTKDAYPSQKRTNFIYQE